MSILDFLDVNMAGLTRRKLAVSGHSRQRTNHSHATSRRRSLALAQTQKAQTSDPDQSMFFELAGKHHHLRRIEVHTDPFSLLLQIFSPSLLYWKC